MSEYGIWTLVPKLKEKYGMGRVVPLDKSGVVPIMPPLENLEPTEPIEEVVSRAISAVKAGYAAAVGLGVDITEYGKKIPRYSFLALDMDDLISKLVAAAALGD